MMEWLGFGPKFWNRNALLSGFDYRVINNQKLGTNLNNQLFLLYGFCTITHRKDCFKKDSSRRSSQKSACHSSDVPAVTYAALAPVVECVSTTLAILFAAPTHVIGYITLAAVAYTASATTTRATVLTQTTATFPCCSSEVLPTMLVTEETREEKAGLWLKELEERKEHVGLQLKELEDLKVES